MPRYEHIAELLRYYRGKHAKKEIKSSHARGLSYYKKEKITNEAGNKKEITIFRNGRLIDLLRRPRISFDVIYR